MCVARDINDLWIMWAMKKKLYSYQRWSSAVQKEGTTKGRQEDAARRYAALHDLDYVEIVDDGMSAFHSQHLNSKKGALGKFLDAINQGFINTNAVLYLESLDRLARSDVDNALVLFMGILKSGLQIYTGFDNKLYDANSIKNPYDLMQSIITFSRGNEESKTKQRRTLEATKQLIKQHKEGLPVTIKAVGSHPWWIDASTRANEKVKKHPVYWPIAQKIVEMLLSGMSIFKIVTYLNTTYPLGYKGKDWTSPNISNMKCNKALYGVREIVLKTEDVKYTLVDYYPPLVSEVQFNTISRIQSGNKYLGDTSGKKRNVNLLAGLGLLRCGTCGGTMAAMRDNNTKQDTDQIRYQCEKGRTKTGCRAWSITGDLVEHAAMEVLTIAYIKLTHEGALEQEDYSTQVADIKESIRGIDEGITNLTMMVEKGIGKLESTFERISVLEGQRENLMTELGIAERKSAMVKDNSIEKLMMDYFTYAQWGVIQVLDHEYRSKLRDMIQLCFEEVHIWKIDRKITMTFRIKGDDHYLTYSAGEKRGDYNVTYRSLGLADGVAVGDDRLSTLKQLEAEHAHLMGNLLIEARKMLKVVHYPDLDGKLFFPKK